MVGCIFFNPEPELFRHRAAEVELANLGYVFLALQGPIAASSNSEINYCG
jgi:hypothetical protein